MSSSWLDLKTSLFNCVAENRGNPRTFRQILFSDFGCEHEYFYKDGNKWIKEYGNDLNTINQYRKTGESRLKQHLQCYTPSACYKSKKKGSEVIEHINPILQLDFDRLDSYDLDEVKAAIFDLPFVACVSKSVSGRGLFALILISESQKLREYAEHLFIAFKQYGLNPDSTKGRNYSDLRFVSYDENLLYRQDPTPLTIKNFYKPPVKEYNSAFILQSSDRLIKWAVREIESAQRDCNRFETVRRVAYTLGGTGTGLEEIRQTIINSPQFAGEVQQFLLHADNAFKAGSVKPLAA